MRAFLLVNIILILTIVVGCTPPSLLKAVNTTKPVLFGKIKNIEGEIVDKNQMQQDSSFSISVNSSRMHYYALYVVGYSMLTEGSNKVDAQLLPFIESTAMDTKKFVMIDEIRFHSWATYLLFYLGVSNHGWLDGSVYEENSN